MKIITTDNASATQTEHPWRATARTLLQSILGATVAIVGVLIFAPGAMDELADALGELGIVIPATLIALPPVIARIMAIPGIEKALRGIGLGAAPAEPDFGHWDGESDKADFDDFDDVGDVSDGTIEVDESDDSGETRLTDVDRDALGAAEVDLTPPPDGYGPRH